MNKFKKCSKCKEEKSLDCFSLNKRKKYGVASYCKLCMRIYNKEYHSKNKENLRKYSKEYRSKNREKINKRRIEYYLKNKEYFNKRSREYYLKNKENLRKKSREYNSKNKEKINKYFKEYRSKNREKINKMVWGWRERLEDGYIVQLITQNTGLTTADIPSELIEAKRLEIKIKRIIKEE